jgi:class 3 adenylate cyclase
MVPIPIPANESERIETLRDFAILDTPPEPGFDDIAELAAHVCGAPIAFIGFIDETRDWLKATCGMPPGMNEVPRELSVCSVTLCAADLVHIPDIEQEPRYEGFFGVKNGPNIRLYCGMPLITSRGHALGTLCIIDFVPRSLQPEQLESVRRLARQLVSRIELRRKVSDLGEALTQLDRERTRARSLLLNILPPSVAEELDRDGHVQPRFYPSATVLFTDFKDFTPLVERTEPAALVALLDQYFTGFDEIVAAHRMERLKTIGDAYMAVAGVPEENRTHAMDACLAALRLKAYMQRVKTQRERVRLPYLEARIGIHTGSVIAGIVGKQKFAYDIWGDSVNVAARIEAAGESMRINVSERTAEGLEPLFVLTPRGSIEVKGPLKMFFLDRLRAEFSADPDGTAPNDAFRAERQRLGPAPGASTG